MLNKIRTSEHNMKNLIHMALLDKYYVELLSVNLNVHKVQKINYSVKNVFNTDYYSVGNIVL